MGSRVYAVGVSTAALDIWAIQHDCILEVLSQSSPYTVAVIDLPSS